MRLISFSVESFKNLHQLSVDFDKSSSYTVLVGENGAGKSNLLEALTLVFRNLDLDEAPPFNYRIEYVCRGRAVRVIAADGTVSYWTRSETDDAWAELTKKAFMSIAKDKKPEYRPAFVFGYYSGPSDRLASLYEKHKDRFYTAIIRPLNRRAADEPEDPNDRRRLFYAQTLHGQFALLAFFMATGDDHEEDRAFLREHLQIEALDSVLFVINKPPWGNTRKGGDERFWNAQGEVSQFLATLYQSSTFPIRIPRRITSDLGKSMTVETLYLFLRDTKALAALYDTYQTQYRFFTALESTHLSKVLGEVRTRVRMTPAAGGGTVTYRDLSEGEQQLLLVLGLLKFTARDEALFLLDEPDTHLNPIWGSQYLEFLDRFIKMRERRDSCHIVMSSHDPLVLAGLRREQVRILRRSPIGDAIVEVPDDDPRGMGVSAILTSDLFRLRTTLDSDTQNKLDRQQLLATKDKSAGEAAELAEINKELHGLGFTQDVRDPLYRLFLRAWTEQQDPTWNATVVLTPEQQALRDQLAAEIVAQLREEADLDDVH